MDYVLSSIEMFPNISEFEIGECPEFSDQNYANMSLYTNSHESNEFVTGD